MIDDMMIRNLSPATQQSYLYAVAKFSRHFGRWPDRLGLEEVLAYQAVTLMGRFPVSLNLGPDFAARSLAGFAIEAGAFSQLSAGDN